MRRVCGHGDVGRCLSIEGIRGEISWVWNPTAYKEFLAMLTDLEHPEACFLSGIKAFFIEHREYNDLWCAAEGCMMWRPIYVPSCFTETMEVAPPTTP
jgi:hypothetical protein